MQSCGTVKIFLRYRFLLLKSYGTGSDFWKSYGSGSGLQILQEKFWNFFAFLPTELFYKEKVYKFQQIYCEMWMKFVFMKVIKYIMLYLVLVPVPTF